MYFKCVKCGSEYEYGSKIWKCGCGGYLKLIQKVKFTKDDIKRERLNMWRYDNAYPLKYDELAASFDEGMTPLVKMDWGDVKIHAKLDSLMPSCSFKDRGMAMAVNYLINQGVEYITEDSSGNAAASVAAYCARGGIKCKVYVPAGNSSGKITQTRAYGAEITEVLGTRDEVADAAQVHSESYAGHNWHPVFAAGLKSIAYELWEQNGFKAPECIITPCGGGSLTLGLIDGFKELLENGEIDALPKIVAVQPENCNPVYRRFMEDKAEFAPTPTIAEGTSIAKPVKADEIIEGIRRSKGTMVSVREKDIRPALIKACNLGVYAEPTSAIAFAAVDKLKNDGFFEEKGSVIVVVSGNGLKAGDAIKPMVE